mmetsp:Transcript_48236/g.113866  ORF Transcript_48236/g.113866 Transcript_48236/m.113866 type:complete len:217 (-) Transcript_48236:242-892(-)
MKTNSRASSRNSMCGKRVTTPHMVPRSPISTNARGLCASSSSQSTTMSRFNAVSVSETVLSHARSGSASTVQDGSSPCDLLTKRLIGDCMQKFKLTFTPPICLHFVFTISGGECCGEYRWPMCVGSKNLTAFPSFLSGVTYFMLILSCSLCGKLPTVIEKTSGRTASASCACCPARIALLYSLFAADFSRTIPSIVVPSEYSAEKWNTEAASSNGK